MCTSVQKIVKIYWLSARFVLAYYREYKDWDSCNNHDEMMNVAKSLKQTVLKLEQSENDNTHINTIKSVTDDGKCIEFLSSEEVLERVQLYHQLES